MRMGAVNWLLYLSQRSLSTLMRVKPSLCTFTWVPHSCKLKHHLDEKAQIPPQITPRTILNPFFFFWHLSWFARQIVKLLLHTVPTHSCFEPRLHGEGTVIAVCLGRRNGAMTCHQQQQLRGCSLDTEMRRVKSPKTINPCTFIFFPREEQGERCCRTFHLWWFNILRRGMEAAALLLCNPPFCHSHFDFSLSWPCFEGKRRENTMVTWNWLQVAAQGSEVFPEKLVRSGKGNMFSKRTESRRVLFRPHW